MDNEQKKSFGGYLVKFLSIFLIICLICIINRHLTYKDFKENFEPKKAYYELVVRYDKNELLNNPTYENLLKLVYYQKKISGLNRKLNHFKNIKNDKEIKDMKPIKNILEYNIKKEN